MENLESDVEEISSAHVLTSASGQLDLSIWKMLLLIDLGELLDAHYDEVVRPCWIWSQSGGAWVPCRSGFSLGVGNWDQLLGRKSEGIGNT